MLTVEPWTPANLRRTDPRVGEVWQHYRGGCYRIVGYAWDQTQICALVLFVSIDPQRAEAWYACDPRDFDDLCPDVRAPKFRRLTNADGTPATL